MYIVLLLLCSSSVMSVSFATPWTVAHQAPLSMGFSRQEYWSTLPLPSPGILLTLGSNASLLHCRSHQGSSSHCAAAAAKSLLSCLTRCDPMGCSPTGSPVPGILQARILEWVAISFSRDLLDPGIEPRSPALQEPPGKPLVGDQRSK